MGRYFFDTSALVKRYHTEAGTQAVDAIFSEPGAGFCVSRLALVECVSALCLKVRSGDLMANHLTIVRKALWGDVRSGTLSVSRLLIRHLEVAETLLLRHGPARRLRTFDAIHLGVALDLFARQEIDMFVSTDSIQCEIASVEGLPTANPLAPSP